MFLNDNRTYERGYKMDKKKKEEAADARRGGNADGISGKIKHSIEAARAKRDSPLMDLLTFLIAFLFSRCHIIFGSHPLAIAFLAVLPTRVWIGVLGAITGALSLGKSGIIYAMISAIVVFLRIIVSGTERSEDAGGRVYLKMFSEGLLLKMSASVIGGFIAAVYEVLLSGFSMTSVLFGLSMIIIPPLLVFSLSGLFDMNYSLRYIFEDGNRIFDKKGKSEKEIFNSVFFRCSAMLLLFLISVSLKEYEILGISPAYIFSAAATLIVARRFGALMGCGVGFVTSFGISGMYSVAFALAGIAAGGLYSLSLIYGIGGGAITLGVWAAYVGGLTGVLTLLPEYGIAALIIYPLIKRMTHEKTGEETEELERSAQDMVGTVALTYRNRYKGALAALEMSLLSISSVVKDYGESSARPTREELYDLILECRDKYCNKCDGYAVCMQKTSKPFIEGANDLAEILYRNGKISTDDLIAHPEYCKMSDGIVSSINRAAAILAEEKFREAKKDTASDDFAIIAKLINEARIHDDREKALNERLSSELADVMKDAGLEDGVIRAFGEKRPYFILAAEDETGERISAPELKRNIEHISGVLLGTPEFYRKGKMALMECPSKRSYKAECAIAQIAGVRDEISGDTAAAFESNNGYFHALLSDGMGSGKEAKETSGFVLDFFKRALEFNAEGGTVMKILNHTIRHRHRECSATVDLFSVDLYMGDAEFIKSGAAPSYVKRGSSIFRIKSKTAPIGLLKAVDAEKIHVDLEGDDYIIMFSDGIAQSAEDAAWLLELLGKPPKRNLKEYADYILSSAMNNISRNDDMTVMITHVTKSKD